MELSEEQKDAIHVLMERFWKDVSALPWTDPGWVSNADNRQLTEQHYVTATANDVINLVQGGADATTASND